MSEPHDVVKLLLARMGSHPEEFTGVDMTREQNLLYTSRWGSLVSQFWYALTTEEQAALNNGLIMANRNNFHTAVMKELLDPKESKVRKQMEQMELFPAQTAYPPGGKPANVITTADITRKALEILEDEIDHNIQKQRGR